MAVERTNEASTSKFGYAYDVFLSFRGSDTRKTFTDHLYTALVNGGFRTFRDDDEIRRGEQLKSELHQARVSIVVFSKDYASSSWCLDELVTILDHKNTSDHVVIPVFYDVDPSEVRKQTRSVADAFARHESDERSHRWRAALRDAADLAGMCLSNQADGHESKFIQKIIKVIEDKLRRAALDVAPYLVGMHFQVEKINLWLQDGSIDVGIILICGIGGIGKTTIAKFVYNSNFQNFEAAAFLPNVREISKQPGGLVCLQRQLLSKLLNRKHEKVWSADEGIIKIKDAIGFQRILLVLDDVDQEEQLDAIIGMRKWFCPGSKVIITSRCKRLLKTNEVYEVHEVRKLNDEDSLNLFSWHCFGQDRPIEAYLKHSKEVVDHCGGLPLALKVLGCSLSGRSVDVWESALKKLKGRLDNSIGETLRISYDSLQDDHDRNLFLDIACFFVGKDKNWIVGILDECDFYTVIGIQNLIDRCLLTISKNNKVVMHQLICDMGREIVCQQSTNDLGKRSRLWHSKDSFYVLKEKMGTETVEGLVLDAHMFQEDRSTQTSFNNSNAKERCLNELLNESKEGNSQKRCRFSFFSWYPANTTSVNSTVVVESDSFAMMHKLRLLELRSVQLTGSFKGFPRRLRWLCWQGFSSNFIPTNFPMESLVALEMPYSSLKQVWRGTKFLAILKFLDLSHSRSLVKTPDFSETPNLERVILEGCTSLMEVHDSIGRLKRLVLLNLRDCKVLRELPRNIGRVKVLETLVISGCSNLKGLPMDISAMESLNAFYADRIDVHGLLTATGEVRQSHAFAWLYASKLIKCPETSSASLPHSLVTLSLAYCNLSNDDFPSEFSSLSMLKDLNLAGNQIQCLPDCLKGLSRLENLSFRSCRELRSIMGLPQVKNTLDVVFCHSLERITCQPSALPPKHLCHSCSKLSEAHNWFKLQPIAKFDAQMIEELGLSNLESLENVKVDALFNGKDDTQKYRIQGLFEYGIFSTFIPGKEIAAWVSHKSKGSSISFTAAALAPNARIRGLNVCCVYTCSGLQETWSPLPLFTKVRNMTKRLSWMYTPNFIGMPEEGRDMIWLSHWKFGADLEVGAEVKVCMVVGACFRVVECGIKLVYEDADDDTQQSNAFASWTKVITRDMTPRKFHGACFLSSYTFGFQRRVGSTIDYDYTNTDWFKQLFEDP